MDVDYLKKYDNGISTPAVVTDRLTAVAILADFL
jgi:hypothetical protein